MLESDGHEFDDERERKKVDYLQIAKQYIRCRPYDVSCGRIPKSPLPKCCICHKRAVCMSTFFPCEHYNTETFTCRSRSIYSPYVESN